MKNAVLIGVGMVADTHRLALEASSHARLAAVCARRPERAEDYAGKHGLRALTLAEACADPDIDFAIIATPPSVRVDIVGALVQARKPILLEKPIERSLAAATSIVERCEAAKLPLGMVFQHRMRRASQKLTQLMAEGAFGPLALAQIDVPWWRSQEYYNEPGRGTIAQDGGGVLMTQAIHTLDLALSLTGPVAQVQAMARTSKMHRMEAEDVVAAGLDFVNGATGTLTATTANFPGRAESITLHCADASARLERTELHIHWRDGRTETFGEGGDAGGAGADPMAFTHTWHQRVIEDFVASLEEGRPPLVTGRAALKTHALIEGLMESSLEGKRMKIRNV
ncbi:Gfo/Idh/MocA family protein [Litoreibacter janthinus]|uniref:Predicted dehydrogenase n=1 Tax=Litoreibacter janthinus TaxID=670154 RepID=A0A1I6GKA8_9RHOB|nr:Gfo/Idh/MocA family oxidoreductase [Litoreibacter janthinus]SFR42497.1 Predicted dehydrogenase [Litoreibacter janthinus]